MGLVRLTSLARGCSQRHEDDELRALLLLLLLELVCQSLLRIRCAHCTVAATLPFPPSSWTRRTTNSLMQVEGIYFCISLDEMFYHHRSSVGARKSFKKTVPVFDIVLLGLGSDGHTASIFPGSQAEELDGAHCAVSVSFPSKTMNPKVWRVTLTSTSIVHARNDILLATGGEKKWVLEGILADAPARVPVARFIRSCAGNVVFLLEKNISQGLVP